MYQPRFARGIRLYRSSVVIASIVLAVLVSAVPSSAEPVEPYEPNPDAPTNACLSNIKGSLGASPQAVVTGQSTALSWSYSGSSACTLSFTISSARGDVPVAKGSSPLTVTPLFGTNDSTTFNLSVSANGASKFLASTVVYETNEIVNGRTTVRIDDNSQLPRFVKAAGTPNTTVLISNGVEFDLGSLSKPVTIARGVHILGTRSSSKLGPRLFTRRLMQPMLSVGKYHPADGVRISGIRIDGGEMGTPGSWGGLFQDDDPAPIGINVNSSTNVEISNNEIYGWSGQAVLITDNLNRIGLENATAVRVHDNYIHHNRRFRHLGYGVQTNEAAYVLLERNVFDYNRHALESSGEAGNGYLAYRNLLLSNGGENSELTHTHQFDVHGTVECDGFGAYCGDAGEYFDYRYNTLTYTAGTAIKVRGKPDKGADVAYNVFAAAEGNDSIMQTEGVNLWKWDNTFGASFPTQHDVCDFDGDGTRDDFLATGATWWFKGSAGHWSYLNTSAIRIDGLELGDRNSDGFCDVRETASDTVFDRGSRLVKSSSHKTKVSVSRMDIVLGTPGEAHVLRLDPQLTSVARDARVMARALGGAFLSNGEVVASGDFNGDGNGDLLWKVGDEAWTTLLDDNGAVVTGIEHRRRTLGASQSINEGAIPATASIAGTGDFNADGRSDVLWRKANGQLILWFSAESGNSATVNRENNVTVDDFGIGHEKEVPVPLDWKVIAIGDFNADSYSDILWRHDNGQVAIWYMNHAMTIGEAYTGGTDPDKLWSVNGVADFDGDGHDDIMWRDTAGRLAVWLRGLYEYGQAYPSWHNQKDTVTPHEWEVTATADMNADGHADIVWTNADQVLVAWYLRDGRYLGESQPITLDVSTMKGLMAQGTHKLDLP